MAEKIRVEPVWIEAEIALAVHDRQLAEHGGPSGLRNEGGLESALARPRNHPFADGNKRTAWVLARLFLRLNGQTLWFTPREAIDVVLALAGGELSEEELADWFRAHLV